MLDSTARTLEVQRRSPRPNLVALSAAFADAVEIVGPQLPVDLNDPFEIVAAEIVEEATHLGTDNALEFGEIAKEMIETAVEAGDAKLADEVGHAGPHDGGEAKGPGEDRRWRDAAKRGVGSEIEPAFEELTRKLIVGLPGHVGTAAVAGAAAYVHFWS